MNTVWLALANIAIAIWVGTIVYQSSVMAACVFRTLKANQASAFLRVIFPSFYKLGLICALTLLLSLSFLLLLDWNIINLGLLLVAIVMTLCQVISIWLVPKINAAKDFRNPLFKKLHTISVLLTVFILICGVGILILLVQL